MNFTEAGCAEISEFVVCQVVKVDKAGHKWFMFDMQNTVVLQEPASQPHYFTCRLCDQAHLRRRRVCFTDKKVESVSSALF